MGLFSLAYTRPKHVDNQSLQVGRESISDEKTDGSVRSGRSGYSAGIPDSLAFDKIMNGGTCPVCALQELTNHFHLF
jgi:hypothetical protein